MLALTPASGFHSPAWRRLAIAAHVGFWSELLLDCLEGEEQFLPAAEPGFDGEFFAGEVGADVAEGGGVVAEDDAEGFLVVRVQGAGEGTAGV